MLRRSDEKRFEEEAVGARSTEFDEPCWGRRVRTIGTIVLSALVD